MQVENVTQTQDLLANPKNTSNGAAANNEGTTADQAYDFGTLQNTTLAADDVLQLQITVGAGGRTLNDIVVFVFYEVTG